MCLACCLVLVGIGQIAGRRHQQHHGGGWLAALGAHEESQVVLVFGGPQAGRVDATSHALGNGELEVHCPARVLEIVVVEMDAAVLFRTTPEIGFVAAPVVAGHGARRHICEPAVQAVRRSVGQLGGSKIAGKVPGRDGCLAERRIDIPRERLEFLGRERPAEQAGSVDFSVEVSLHRMRTGRVHASDGGHEQRHLVLAYSRHFGDLFRHRSRLVSWPAVDWQLCEAWPPIRSAGRSSRTPGSTNRAKFGASPRHWATLLPFLTGG